MKNEKTLKSWLFSPFKYVAGVKSLYLGTGVMLLLSLLGYLNETHFDGALDVHFNCQNVQTPYYHHLLYQLIGWSSLVLSLYCAARIVTKSSVRLIDIAGTVALAKAPLLFVALIGFVPAFHPCFGDILSTNLGELMVFLQDNIMMIVLSLVFMLPFIIWFIALLYNAYSVSSNVKGMVAGFSFAAALIAAEIISKVFLYLIL